MRKVNPGVVVVDQFPAFEADGYTKRSGLTADDFTIGSFHNGSEVILSVSISEIGITGEYKIQFTPSAVGVWCVQVLILFNKEIRQSRLVVGQTDETVYGLLESVEANLSRVLGLLHYNAMLDNQQYNGNMQLTCARLRVFGGPGNVPSEPGGDEVAEQEYEIQAEYGESEAFTLKKIK